MKKIPTLFEREFGESGKLVGITPKVKKDFEWVLRGDGVATIKFDGACCAIINGQLYKRYDAKNGKQPPEGAIPCQEAPDEITGHFPHWVKCKYGKPEDKWFWSAVDDYVRNHIGDCQHSIIENAQGFEQPMYMPQDGTYEAVGKHFNGNPYRLGCETLMKHGDVGVDVERSFEGIKQFLENHYEEGIVFWKDDEPQCKIKRTDFGMSWGAV